MNPTPALWRAWEGTVVGNMYTCVGYVASTVRRSSRNTLRISAKQAESLGRLATVGLLSLLGFSQAPALHAQAATTPTRVTLMPPLPALQHNKPAVVDPISVPPPTSTQSGVPPGFGALAATTGTTLVAGRTAGTFSVSSQGAATYTIPLFTVPGVRGVQPHLALVYSSSSPDGLLGPGWSLSGLSVISRCNLTWAQDGVAGAVTLTNSDRYCLDGNKLRVTSGVATYGQANSTYQTEIANFSNVVASSTLTGNGPSFFTVHAKDGLIYEYGNSGTQVTAVGTTTPYMWLLDKVTDRYSNTMTIQYQISSGSYVPTLIQYTKTSGGTTFPNSVSFTYTSRPVYANINQYLAGGTLQQTTLLSQITASAGLAVRTTSLGYANGGSTGIPRLNSVQECGFNGDCLTPTTIGYQDGQAGVTNPAATAVAASATSVNAVDLDGDGKMDLVYAIPTGTGAFHWYVQFSTGSGFGTATDTTVITNSTDPILFDDFLGEGHPSILAPNGAGGTTWTLYRWNASTSAFVAAPLTLAIALNGSTDARFASADVDGDGRPDLLWLAADGFVHVRLNTSTGGSTSFAGDVSTGLNYGSFGGTITVFGGNNAFRSSSVKHLDFDGDGRQDLIIGVSGSNPRYIELLGQGTSLGVGHTVPLGLGLTAVLPINWNNDSCTDLAVLAPAPEVVISSCSGSTVSTVSLSASVAGQAAVVDWDGDGRTDLLVSFGSTWDVYISNGDPVTPPTPTAVTLTVPSAVAPWVALDADGDGLDDLAFANSATGAVTYGLHNKPGILPDLAISFTDGYGMNQSPSYTSLAQFSHYTKYTDGAWPDSDYIGPMYVVSSYSASDGAGGTYAKSYFYYGARMNEQGRGFEGFWAQDAYDNRNQVNDVHYFQRAFPYTGMLYFEEIYQPNSSANYSQYFEHQVFVTNLDTTVNNQRYFPYVLNATEQDYQVNTTATNGQMFKKVVASYVYDTYGNATTVTTTSTDEDPSSPWANQVWTSKIVRTITNDTANWCLGVPTQTTVTNTLPSATALTRTTSYSVDYPHCHVTQAVDEPSTPSLKVTTAYGFDACGNINSTGITGNDPNTGVMATRTTQFNYGTLCVMPESVTNAVLEKTTFVNNYNFGTVASRTDPNGAMTSWVYDDLGRVSQEKRPDGTATNYFLALCPCSPTDLAGGVERQVVGSNGVMIRYSYLYWNGNGQQRYDQEENISGTLSYSSITLYDPLGRPQTQYKPFLIGGTEYWHQYEYDAVNRLIADQFRASGVIDREIDYTYLGAEQTVKDPLTAVTERFVNVLGQLGEVVEPSPGGPTSYTYEPFGNLATVTDPAMNVSSWQYDVRGHQVSKTDPDHGTWTYQPNSLGELVNFRDSENTAGATCTAAPTYTQTYTHDALGRMLTRCEKEGVSQWVWGNSATLHNFDRLQSESGPGGYSEGNSFDTIGRLLSTTYTADTTYTVSYAYNATTGLPDNVTYPASTGATPLRIQYGYTNGIRTKVSDYNAGTVFWQMTAQDAYLHPTDEQLSGAAMQLLSTYDPLTGLLTARSSGTASPYTNLQNLSFVWDKNNNLEDRIDVKQANLDEHFTYDALNRFNFSTLSSLAGHNLDVSLDASGNMLSKTSTADPTQNVGSYVYTGVQTGCTYATGQAPQPHAVRNAGGNVYCYDPNGNMVTRATSTSISYFTYNLPNTISSGSSSSSFAYTPDRKYWKQSASYSGAPETSIYIGGVFEKVSGATTTDFLHLIRAGDVLVLVVRSTGTNNETYYVAQDHLGSSALIMNHAGVIQVSASYSTYGARRGSNWQGAPSSSDMTAFANTTRHGFGGQTMLDNLSLTHMNGRVYDPLIGRFTSADPNVDGPSNGAQGYNFYTYVYNNPLRYVDPTGFGIPCITVEGVDENGNLIQLPGESCNRKDPWDDSNGNLMASPPTSVVFSNFQPIVVDLAPTLGQVENQTKQLKIPVTPCDNAGGAAPPEAFAQKGTRLKQQITITDPSTDEAHGGDLGIELQTYSSFHRGGSLDAQASGSDNIYANYVYGVFMQASGNDLNFALSGADAYAHYFGGYEADRAMDEAGGYPHEPADNAAAIEQGFNDQSKGSTCKISH